MFKKIFLSALILFYSANIQALTIGKILEQIISSFYVGHYFGHCAADNYYSLAKKTNAQDESIIRKTHIYINALLVQSFCIFLSFPFVFAADVTKATDQEIVQKGKELGKAAHASFILPALGAIVLAYGCYFIAKKIITLIK